MGNYARDLSSEAAVEAAAGVLRESGLMEYWPGSPAIMIVRQMLEAAGGALAGNPREQALRGAFKTSPQWVKGAPVGKDERADQKD